MCGIYGEFSFSGHIAPNVSCQKLDLLKHRGPDGFGWEFGNFKNGKHTIAHNSLKNPPGSNLPKDNCNYFLGHRRLSIIDLSDNAFQPMESSNGQLSIVFNGEIYNYIELRSELEKAGCDFKTDHSDTEVLLNAYLIWGEKCLDRLNGMFAFVILDRHKQILFIARDRIGKKPLYYEFNESNFCFSSELGPLVKHDTSRRVIDQQALYQYLLFGYILHPNTIFQEIYKLPPASFGIIDLSSQKLSIHKYWDINIVNSHQRTFNDYLNEVDNYLNEAVSIRLRADVPIGAFVSGGIDSTLVIKKIKEITQKQYDVFGADFPGTNRSEKKYIEEAAAYYNQRLHLSNVDISHTENIDDVIAVFDEPFDGGSSVAVFDLFRSANNKKYKVILTGDGGDETFAGYKRYQQFQRVNDLLETIKLPSSLKNLLNKYLSAHTDHSPRIMHLLHSLAGNKITSYIYMNYDFNLTKLLKNKSDFCLNDITTIKEISEKIQCENFSSVKAAQYFDLKTILPGRMLYKIDRFSMFFGVEARAPFLDHKMVEFAFSIPDTYNINRHQTKNILKKMLRKDFPSSFVYRKKQGFGNPFDNWFRSPQAEQIFSTLLNKESLIYNFLNYQAVRKLFPGLTDGCTGWRAKQLWRLVVLGNFLENNKKHITLKP